MKPENFTAEMNQILSGWNRPQVSESDEEAINAVTIAIRSLGRINCTQIAQIFDTLASQMKRSDFSSVDLDALDEVRGFICGEAA